MDLIHQLAVVLQHSDSIELVPSDDASLLVVDRHLGIPHNTLRTMYLAAVPAFVNRKPNPDSADLHALSAVLIIANPAHQTALNTRKTLVERGHLDPQGELDFMSALLPIKDCAKSSIQWHHRRWLLVRIYASHSEAHIDTDERFTHCPIPPAVLRSEMSLVSTAATVYPRNYHAWHHRTLCMRSCASQASHSFQHELLLHDEQQVMMTWTQQHVSDHSAAHHLQCLSSELARVVRDTNAQGSMRETGDLMQHAEDLCRAYPSHESLWYYLRHTYATELLRFQESGGVNAGSAASLTDHVKDVAVALASKINSSPSISDEERSTTVRHALRFLTWMKRENTSVSVLRHINFRPLADVAQEIITSS